MGLDSPGYNTSV